MTRMWHNVTQKFVSPSALRIKLMDSFPDRLPVSGDFQIGYLGKKGTKRWIESPEDLAALNRSFNSGDEVTLWCEPRRSEGKRKKGDDDDEPTCSKRAKHDQEVDEAYQKLKSMHPDMNMPKLKLWARMITNGQHESFEDPPKIPLFTGGIIRKNSPRESLSDVVKTAATAVANVLNKSTSLDSPSKTQVTAPQTTVSPARTVQLNSKHLQNIRVLHELYENGVLSDEEFREQKHLILNSMRKLGGK